MLTSAELRENLEKSQAHLAKAFELAGETIDFNKKEVLEHLGAKDSSGAVEKVAALRKEQEGLQKDAQAAYLQEVKDAQSKLRDDLGKPVNTPPQPHGDGGGRRSEVKSPGQRFIESVQYKRYKDSKGELKEFAVVIEDVELKTLFQTSAGWPPESTRTGLLVEAVTRPIQLLDLIPADTTEQASVVYMEETTRTHAAAERAEGAPYSESTFVTEEKTSTVRSIGDSLPVTDEQLEDVGQVRSYINSRLMFGTRQRLDGQIVNGNGTAPNLRGILNVVGIQTQAKGADPTFDTIHKAMTKVRRSTSGGGGAFPNAVLLEPTDWEEIRLTRTADGIYIMGNPSQAGPMTLFGLPVVIVEALAAGTGLVGDFANFSRLYERRGIEIRVGFVADQFKEGKQTVRADLRVAFVVTRPAAFCTVTGI